MRVCRQHARALRERSADLERAELREALVEYLFLAAPRRMPDGERRGARSNRRVGGVGKKGLGETRIEAPSDRYGSSAFAVGVLRGVKKNGADRESAEHREVADFEAILLGQVLEYLADAPCGDAGVEQPSSQRRIYF